MNGIVIGRRCRLPADSQVGDPAMDGEIIDADTVLDPVTRKLVTFIEVRWDKPAVMPLRFVARSIIALERVTLI